METSTSTAVDESFVCNVCLSQLHIARFKCTCCVDFDVCEECLNTANESHQNHIFLKINISGVEENQQKVGNSIPSVAEQLAALDGVQYFRLDQDAISKQLRIPSDVVQWTIGSMFEQLAAEQNTSCEDECPDLLDDDVDDPSSLPHQSEQRRMNVDGIADFEGTNAMMLWDSLEAVAHDDDVDGVAQLDALQHRITQKDSTHSYNLRALLRISNLAGKLIREPVLQKRILKLAEVVVSGNSRIMATKRKSLQQALKKQSRSRTKAATEDIVLYAASTHFTQAPAGAGRSSATRKGSANNSNPRSNKSRSGKKKHHKPKHQRSGHGKSSDKDSVMQVSPGSVDTSSARGAVGVLSMSDSEDISGSSEASTDESEQQETENEGEAEQELVAQSEARLPANRRATRTMRKEVMRETIQHHQVTPSSTVTTTATTSAHSRTYFTDTETDTDMNRSSRLHSGDYGESSNNLSETFNEVAEVEVLVFAANKRVEEEEELQGWLSPNELAEVHRRTFLASRHTAVEDVETTVTSVMEVVAFPLTPPVSIDSPTQPAATSATANVTPTVPDVTPQVAPQQQPPLQQLPQPRRRGRTPKRKPILDAVATAFASVFASTPIPTPIPAVAVSPIDPAPSSLALTQRRHTPRTTRGTKRAATSDNNGDSSDNNSNSNGDSDSSSSAHDTAAAALMAECEVLLPTHMRATRTMRNVAAREVSQWKGQGMVPPVPTYVPEVTPQKRKKRKVKNSPSSEAVCAVPGEAELPLTEDVVDVSADDAMGDGHLPPDGTMASSQQAQRCLTVVFDPTILFSCWSQHYGTLRLFDHNAELYVPNYSALHTSLIEHCHTTYVIYRRPSVTRPSAQETTDTISADAPAPILTCHSALSTTVHITHPMKTANPSANITFVQRSILKKRTYDETTPATTTATSFDTTTALQSHGTSRDSSTAKRAKKGVSFDITASMQYKRWRSGRTSHFSVEAALLEVQGQSEPSTAANNNAVANMRVVSATYGASLFPPLPPLLTWLPSSPLPNLPPLPSTNTNTPPSILKKRSYSESVTTNDDTILTDTEPYVTPDQQPPRKCVRFSEEVPAESKERTGVYMSYKRRIAERTARLAAMLQQPTATTTTTTAASNKRASSGTAYSIAACTGGKLGSRTATATTSTYNSDSSSSNSDSSSSSGGTFMELTSTNLGSFWGSSTFRTNSITTNNEADSNQRNRNITWSTRSSHDNSSAVNDRGSPQESDTESDLTEVSSQSPPPAWPTYPAGTTSTSGSYTRMTSSNNNSNTSSSSKTNKNASTNNSKFNNDSVQPCSLYEEFLHQEYEFNPFIAPDFSASGVKHVDAQDENVDTSNTAISTTSTGSINTTVTCTTATINSTTTDSACDEDSPFFEDDPYYTHQVSKRAPTAHVTPKFIANTSATATVSPDDASVERNLWSEDVL